MILTAVLLLASLSGAARAAPPPAPPGTHRVNVVEGSVQNHFYRRGAVAAHLLASSGAAPRLIVAFSAVVSGFGVWFV